MVGAGDFDYRQISSGSERLAALIVVPLSGEAIHSGIVVTHCGVRTRGRFMHTIL